MKKLLYITFLFLALVACESTPSDLLSKGEMEDILYDIHIAQNMDDNSVSYDEKGLREITLRKSIFDKYGVSQAQWDTSFNYYCRHTEQLYEIYESLSERLRQNVIDAGGDVEGDLTMGGDTSNVWNKDRAFILMPTPPYNLRTFNIDADSTYLPGDRLTLTYKTQFIFQDGMRDLVCVFTVTLGNDSVVNEVRHVNSTDQTTSMTLEDRDDLGIKNIRMYFMAARNLSDDLSSTLRLISVENVKLIRNHCDREKKDAEKARQDSIKASSDANAPRPLIPAEKEMDQEDVKSLPEIRSVPAPPPLRPARSLTR